MSTKEPEEWHEYEDERGSRLALVLGQRRRGIGLIMMAKKKGNWLEYDDKEEGGLA